MSIGDDLIPGIGRDLIADIDLGLRKGTIVLALFTSLTLPDIAAAASSTDGKTNGAKYMAWVDQYLSPMYRSARTEPTILTGHDVYGLRCAMLHQGRPEPHGPGGGPARYSRIVFNMPGSGQSFDRMILDHNILALSPTGFCLCMMTAFARWREHVKDDPNVQANAARWARRQGDGSIPYLTDVIIFG
jgi:hypothetical protein